MVNRSIAPLSRLGAAATLVVLGITALLQVGGAIPTGAAGSSVVLLSWGDNSSGELGNGNTTNISTPSAVSLPPGVTPTAISGGGGLGDPQPSQYAAYAVGSDGNLYAWGDNSRGALGNGTTSNSSTPVLVSLPSGVTPTAMTASQGTGYAIGSDGHLYAWGDNTYGTLGNGTSVTFSDTPVLVSLPTGVTADAISGGYESAYAIGSDGHLYAWGDSFYGELGNGGTTNSDTPVVVSLPSGVTPQAIAGGGGTGYAIGSDARLYAWGLNASGQLGDGSTNNSSTPVVVSLPLGVTPTSIAGAGGFAYAVGSDGHLYAWGNDSGGQLGNGSTTNSSTPVVVLLPSGVTPKAISGNYFVGYAIGSDGNLYAWGGNGSGDLGDGTTTNSSTPVLVSLPPGSTPLKLASEPGSASGYAIVSAPDVAPSITTNPTNQSVSAGQDAILSAAASGIPAPTVQWQVSTNGGSTFSPVSGATSDSLTISSVTLSENGYEYEAVFTNGSGTATTNPATLTVIPPPPPTTTVNIPSNGATVSGDIWLGASAQSVVGVKSVSYEVSGGSVSNLVVSSSGNSEWGWIGAWDTTDVANGTYTLQSVATDTNGNSAPSPGVSVTVDNLPLHTQVLVPSNGATLNGTGAVLDAIASGTSDVTGVQFEVTDGSLSGHVVGTAGATIYGWIALWDTNTVPNGSYTLQSVATETGGTTATSPGITINVTN
jgi:alpha-tubulin suppressor-like RCC1 family protein